MTSRTEKFLRAIGARGGQPLRYALAGTANTAFSLAIYPALLFAFPYYRAHYMLGLAVTQPIGITFSFMTQKFGVFRTSTGNILVEYVRFVSFYIAYFIMNWAALPFMVEVLRFPPVAAQTGFQTIAMVGGYFWHSKITFLHKQDGQEKIREG